MRAEGLGAGPARASSVRAHNLALVLHAVADAGVPVSRAEVSTRTGLTRASVSALVDALLAGRLLHETGASTRVGVGRPSTGLSLHPNGPAGLGLELNVGHLAACVVDFTGAVRLRRSVAIDRPGHALDQFTAMAADALTAAGADGLDVSGVAVAAPGLIDAATGRLVVAPNLGSTDLFDTFTAELGLPVVVENEATLAARAEQRALGRAASRSFLQISGEVGIGAGLVLDGRLYRGRHGWSGELGHVTVWPGGRPCACGSDGCLEQYAGQHAILRAAGVPGGAAADIAARAAAGDVVMLAALAEAGQALGIALAGALNLLDLDEVVLGGLLAGLAPWLVAPIEAELSRRLIGAPVAMPVVRPSTLGADAAALGAAWAVLDRILEAPADWLTDQLEPPVRAEPTG